MFMPLFTRFSKHKQVKNSFEFLDPKLHCGFALIQFRSFFIQRKTFILNI